MHRQYLGDSVYVEIEQGMIRLCTNNGMGDQNVILLEDSIFDKLAQYVADLRRAYSEPTQAPRESCPHCAGAGQIPTHDGDGNETGTEPCARCGGDGKL